MSYSGILKQNIDEVRSMKAQGFTSIEIADRFGIYSPDSVRTFCSHYGIKSNGFVLKNTQDEASSRISEASNGMLEYLSGYQTKESLVRVRCLKCGGEFERTFHHLTTHKPVTCPLCKEKERRDKEDVKEQERADRAWLRAVKAYEAKQETQKNVLPHLCPVCGAITTKPKYCSEECRLKANNTAGEHRRRLAIKTAMVDRDITVLSLFNKSRGQCAICGKPCDLNDYTEKDGYFIAGNNYPSIDHIIPLAKGGEHSWDNVQLAHRLCNSKKSDHLDV